MTIEQQVCSLELAKRLKELGVKQDSYFLYLDGRLRSVLSLPKSPLIDFADMGYERISAPTATELKKILPEYTKTWREDSPKNKYPWVCQNLEMLGLWQDFFVAKTEADACAKMLIYLLENKIITI